ncbi:MAG: class II glutamine amidotransferase [Bdellovibrionales bacterium]|nr:class II glutamine amidotransferase [Bdellovibrionales bacterium]
MCRFLAYTGTPILIDEVIYQPKNSLIRQSFQAQEREEPLNGDGFGLGWYALDISAEPGVFVSVQPAWHNRNLKSLASKTKVPCFFAHVRAATVSDVSEANCHPFRFGNLLMMHNGDIGGFEKIQRPLRRMLSDETYHWVRGQTDSEHFFALFIDCLKKQGEPTDCEAMYLALKDAINVISELQERFKISEASYLNFAVTDGKNMVAVRSTTDKKLYADTLYYSEGTRYQCKDGVCTMLHSGTKEKSVLVVSEKLTEIKEDWLEVPVNNAVLIDEKLNISIKEFNPLA